MNVRKYACMYEEMNEYMCILLMDRANGHVCMCMLDNGHGNNHHMNYGMNVEFRILRHP